MGDLKTTPRVGYKKRGVPNYESVADHSWRVASLCFLLSPDEYDIDKCLAMAVVHDMAECIVGDIVPEDNIPKAVKQEMEWNAMNQIVNGLAAAGEGTASSYLLELFHEYEERQSKESKAVKDLDQLDLILQADLYERQTGIDIGDFFDGTTPDKFVDPSLREVAKEVHERRNERIDMEEELKRRSKEQKMSSIDSGSALSINDQQFVEQFCAETAQNDPKEVERMVQALRDWEGKKSS